MYRLMWCSCYTLMLFVVLMWLLYHGEVLDASKKVRYSISSCYDGSVRCVVGEQWKRREAEGIEKKCL